MKAQIYIHTFGYINQYEDAKVCRANDSLFLGPSTTYTPVGWFVLIVSVEGDTQIRVGEQRIQLKKYHACIYRSREIEKTETIRGQALFAVLGGRLPTQYIHADKIGTVIAFSANDALSGRIRQLQSALDYGKQPNCKALTELGFGLLLDIWAHKTHEKRVPKVVSAAIEIIDNEYGQLYGVDDLADRVGVSKSHLIRQFQASMQITPGAYLEETRIEKAKVLLVSADLDMEMVANLCGYSCANYFGKVFKKKLKTSPSEYAKCNAGLSNTQLPDEMYL